MKQKFDTMQQQTIYPNHNFYNVGVDDIVKFSNNYCYDRLA